MSENTPVQELIEAFYSEKNLREAFYEKALNLLNEIIDLENSGVLIKAFLQFFGEELTYELLCTKNSMWHMCEFISQIENEEIAKRFFESIQENKNYEAIPMLLDELEQYVWKYLKDFVLEAPAEIQAYIFRTARDFCYYEDLSIEEKNEFEENPEYWITDEFLIQVLEKIFETFNPEAIILIKDHDFLFSDLLKKFNFNQKVNEFLGKNSYEEKKELFEEGKYYVHLTDVELHSVLETLFENDLRSFCHCFENAKAYFESKKKDFSTCQHYYNTKCVATLKSNQIYQLFYLAIAQEGNDIFDLQVQERISLYAEKMPLYQCLQLLGTMIQESQWTDCSLYIDEVIKIFKGSKSKALLDLDFAHLGEYPAQQEVLDLVSSLQSMLKQEQ